MDHRCVSRFHDRDPHFHAETLYVNHVKLGWHFSLTTDAAWQRLIVFFYRDD